MANTEAMKTILTRQASKAGGDAITNVLSSMTPRPIAWLRETYPTFNMNIDNAVKTANEAKL